MRRDVKVKVGKRAILVTACLVLVSVWIVMVYRTNKSVEIVPEKGYEIGEFVPMEDDILEYDKMQGYSIRVDAATLMDYSEFVEKYGIESSLAEVEFLPEKVYDVKIVIANTNNKDTGVDLTIVRMQAPDIFLDVSGDIFNAMYPEFDGVMAIALRENTSMEFHVPFNVRREWFRNAVWKNIENTSWNLVLTKYPVKKYVEI